MKQPLSIVVPVFNSAEILPELVRQIDAEIRKDGADVELILVNDGSGDRSWEAIANEVAARDWIRGIDLTRNFGQHNAVLCGLRAASHPVIVTMDDDLQHPPSEVHKLTDELERGFDVVYGVPVHEQHAAARRIATWLTKIALAVATGSKMARNIGPFKALRSSVRDKFPSDVGSGISIDVLLLRATKCVSHVKVNTRPRHSGVSNYTFRKLARHAVMLFAGLAFGRAKADEQPAYEIREEISAADQRG